jgi:CHAD domain-containing protein
MAALSNRRVAIVLPEKDTDVSENLLVRALLKTTMEYWDQLRRSWKDVRRDASEASIHDLRVASRRLGAALGLVESILQEVSASKARRRLKKLMEKLGPLRDVQVQIGIVKKWRRKGGVEKFKELLQRTERRESGRIHRYLSADRKGGIRQALKAFEGKASKPLKEMPAETIKARIEESLNTQRADLEVARKNLVRTDPKSLHALRRTARKLRYSLEAASSAIGAAPEAEVHRLRQLQTSLGHQRDLQILKERFQKWRGEQS